MIAKFLIGLCLLAFLAVPVASGFFLSPQYLEPWQRTYAPKFDDPRLLLVAHGLLAANGHNMQPWKIKLDEDDSNVFYLYADSDRLTKAVDPFARQTMISQGTFLEYIKVAGEKTGYKTEFTFFPEGDYDENSLSESMNKLPVAKILISQAVPQESPIYDYLFFPDTNRAAYKNTPLTLEQITQLQEANTDKDIALNFYQDKKDIKLLGEFIVKGAEIESSVHRIYEENKSLLRVNEYQKNQYRSGFSLDGQGSSALKKHLLQGVVTLVPFLNNEKAAVDVFMQYTKTAADNTPAYATISTDNNSRLAQVKAGMLYSRLILVAHSMGLVMQPPSQVLEEYPEMHEQYDKMKNEYAEKYATIQILLRIGYPTQEAGQSMRRDAKDLLY